MLLSAGAAVDMVDNFGQTALMRAAWNGHFQLAEVRKWIAISVLETNPLLLACCGLKYVSISQKLLSDWHGGNSGLSNFIRMTWDREEVGFTT